MPVLFSARFLQWHDQGGMPNICPHALTEVWSIGLCLRLDLLGLHTRYMNVTIDVAHAASFSKLRPKTFDLLFSSML